SLGSFFFFSSRRRHTRCYRDWSSDVCSSDLDLVVIGDMLELGVLSADAHEIAGREAARAADVLVGVGGLSETIVAAAKRAGVARSEERRVGKEGGGRGGADRGTEAGVVVTWR